ncbi:tetratricopeptide repeat protein [Uliginosibacterium paludis]|uniref:Tetratricopeptide repeat protein n=1 Tax=Uliginosibacterium paludis TaxID=1615952 RepID=A0ABV2CM77_9RHOO
MNLDQARALFLESLVYHEAGDFRRAEALLRRALELSPDRVSIVSNLCGALLAQGRFREALPYAEQACRLEPGSLLSWDHAAMCHEETANWPAALGCLDRALALGATQDIQRRRVTCLLAMERRDEARSVLEALCAAGEALPDDFQLLAAMQFEQGEHARALGNSNRALELAPDFAPAALMRADALLKLGRPAEAREAALHATRCGAGFWQTWFALGNARVECNDADGALEAFERAAELCGDDPAGYRLRWNRALALLQSGDLARGLPAFECRRERPEAASQQWPASPRWDGRRVAAGQTLLLVSEQGLGDTLQFVRYATFLAGMGARVLLWVEPALIQVLAGCPGVAGLFSKDEAAPAHDLHVPMMSLPLLCGTTLDSVPPPAGLKPEAGRREHWNAFLSMLGHPRIGLVWSGNPRHINDQARSMPLQALAPLFGLRADFVSLQKEVREQDRPGLLRHPLLDATDQLEDLADTAALIANLDLVISVDTSVAHLAASLGKPVWLLLPHAAEWRWLRERSDSPWYPSMRLFRQSVPGDWSGVVERVREALQIARGDFSVPAR